MKTPKTNFLQLDKLYTFAFRLHPKMYFDFELGFSGVKLITGNQGFRKFKSIHDFELDSNNTIQHIQHKGKLVLVNAHQCFHQDQMLCNAYQSFH